MTVRELKTLLEDYPENYLIMVEGYEGGFSEIQREKVKMSLMSANYWGSPYFGNYEEEKYAQDDPISGGKYEKVNAIIFYR